MRRTARGMGTRSSSLRSTRNGQTGALREHALRSRPPRSRRLSAPSDASAQAALTAGRLSRACRAASLRCPRHTRRGHPAPALAQRRWTLQTSSGGHRPSGDSRRRLPNGLQQRHGPHERPGRTRAIRLRMRRPRRLRSPGPARPRGTATRRPGHLQGYAAPRRRVRSGGRPTHACPGARRRERAWKPAPRGGLRAEQVRKPALRAPDQQQSRPRTLAAAEVRRRMMMGLRALAAA